MQQSSRTVLVVEDEWFVGLMIEEVLEDAGYSLCGRARSEEEAFRLAGECAPAFAVVDINLGEGGSGLNIGRELTPRGVIVLYASAYCPQWWHEMKETGVKGCLQKPYDPDSVPAALEVLAALHAGKRPQRLPSGFTLLV